MPFALYPYTPRSPQLNSDCLIAVPDLELQYHSSISADSMVIYWLGICQLVMAPVADNSHRPGFLFLGCSFS